ncbi:hypothetical protein SASPL_114689 [Salvia splendens]|uniref:Uncharacterized protein n=1 Tax=Salvia splendens TaxID=180675 RepID=A0A8X9A2A4_SALSN|nr:hypothetical protein SASPL_114689 [Salvia splendens]
MAGVFPHAESSSGLQLGPAGQRNSGDGDGRQHHVDPVTLGFAQLNARFDKMDRRVDHLERRPTPQTGGHEADWDEADHAWEDYRGNGRSGREERRLQAEGTALVSAGATQGIEQVAVGIVGTYHRDMTIGMMRGTRSAE